MVFGGLNERGAPLGDVVLLKPNGLGFTWETLEVQPSPVSRSVTNRHVAMVAIHLSSLFSQQLSGLS